MLDDTRKSRSRSGDLLRSIAITSRAALVYVLPARWRASVVSALPRRLAPAEMREDYFDRLYGQTDDPFGFDSHPEEQLKFDWTLGLFDGAPLGRVFEIGCAVGTFTELIAERSTSVLAIDVSARAVELASIRLASHPQVTCEVRVLPRDFPEGRFDLVVASDVLYYLSTDALDETIALIEGALDPGGSFVLVHFAPRMGSMLSGDEVHDRVVVRSSLDHVLADVREFGEGRRYRVDWFKKESS